MIFFVPNFVKTFVPSRESREKDEALLRNAHMSQSIEMSQCEVRYQETEIADLKAKVVELEVLIAQHKEVLRAFQELRN